MNKKKKLEEEFVRTIAHDMKAKLTSMLAYTQLLKRRLPSENADAQRFLTSIESHIKTFTTNTIDITDLVKYNLTDCKLLQERTTVAELMELCLEQFQKAHPDIVIKQNNLLSPITLFIDRARMLKAFDNLFTLSLINLQEIRFSQNNDNNTITIQIEKLYADDLTEEIIALEEIKYLVAELIIEKHLGNLCRKINKKHMFFSITLPTENV